MSGHCTLGASLLTLGVLQGEEEVLLFSTYSCCHHSSTPGSFSPYCSSHLDLRFLHSQAHTPHVSLLHETVLWAFLVKTILLIHVGTKPSETSEIHRDVQAEPARPGPSLGLGFNLPPC